MPPSLLDAFDMVVHSVHVLDRLRDAQKSIARKQQFASATHQRHHCRGDARVH
jgi:hypothetical protein